MAKEIPCFIAESVAICVLLTFTVHIKNDPEILFVNLTMSYVVASSEDEVELGSSTSAQSPIRRVTLWPGSPTMVVIPYECWLDM